jgi:cobalt/nickel transport system permease protein
MIGLRDLRLRIVAAFVVVGCLSQITALPLAALALAVVVLAVMSNRSARPPWRRLLHVEAFLLLLFASLPFTMAGEPLFSLGPISASREGLARAALIACKVTASVLIVMTLLRVDDPLRLGAALRALCVPDRLVRLFLLAARYGALLQEEARRLHDAMRMRAFRARSGRHTWRSYGNLVGMLVVRALARAERVDEAMLCRGGGARFPAMPLPAPASAEWAGFALLIVFGFALALADRL